MTIVEAVMRDECKHLISPPESCVSCFPRQAEPDPPPHPPGQLGPWFPARFGGECDECDECGAGIREGDQIRADGQGGWLCAVCGNAGPSQARPGREELELW